MCLHSLGQCLHRHYSTTWLLMGWERYVLFPLALHLSGFISSAPSITFRCGQNRNGKYGVNSTSQPSSSSLVAAILQYACWFFLPSKVNFYSSLFGLWCASAALNALPGHRHHAGSTPSSTTFLVGSPYSSCQL